MQTALVSGNLQVDTFFKVFAVHDLIVYLQVDTFFQFCNNVFSLLIYDSVLVPGLLCLNRADKKFITYKLYVTYKLYHI